MKLIKFLFALLLLLSSPAWAADTKISAYPELSAISDPTTTWFLSSYAGKTYKVPFSKMASSATTLPYTKGSGAPVSSVVAPQLYLDEVGNVLYFCIEDGIWTAVYGLGADGSYKHTFINNPSGIAPVGTEYAIYVDQGVFKLGILSAEKTIGYSDLSNFSFSSANLSTALTDKTGSGPSVFGTGPTLDSPVVNTPALKAPSFTMVTFSPAAAAVTIDANATDKALITPTTASGASTISFTNRPAAGTVKGVRIHIIAPASGAQTIVWPTTNTYWIRGTSGKLTALTANKNYEYNCEIENANTYCDILSEEAY
jgi:hypothetical protein